MLTHRQSPPKTYVVPVSGGKDSQAVLAFIIDLHGRDRLRVVHQFTGFDHPLTNEHLKYMEERYQVKIEVTKSKKFADIFDLIKKEGYFPNSKAKACTERLKQIPFSEWVEENNLLAPGACHIYMGMRAAESRNRMDKYGGLSHTDVFTLRDLSPKAYRKRFEHVTVSLPIVRWSTELVFEYLKGRGDKINPLYARGHSRVGCYPCLLSGQREWTLAVKDKTGAAHIDRLLEIERDFAAHPTGKKLIRIHVTRDVELLRKTGRFDGASTLFQDEEEGGCSFCSI